MNPRVIFAVESATISAAICVLLAAAGRGAAAGYRPDPAATVLWYRQPAKEWHEAVPVGNGRLGAMPFGNPAEERVLLNEETIWTGGPYQPANTAGAKHIDEIRRLVFQRRYAEAYKLFGRHLMGRPVEQMKYQPLGDLWLSFPGHEEVTDYRRELDLDTAVASVRYTCRGVTFCREVFVSPVDQVIVVRLTADKPGQLSFSAQLTGYRNGAHSNYGSEFFRMDAIAPDVLQLYGRTSTYLDVKGRVDFFARAMFRTEGGAIDVHMDSLTVRGADAVTILIAAATNFVNYRDLSASARERVATTLAKVRDKPYDRIKAEHVRAHRRLIRRVTLDLGSTAASLLPTDERLKRFAEGGADPQLAALYFQYGRYLLISSSRPGTQPANLQGIWNPSMNPMWDSKFTVNINLEMNYWPVDVAGLPECIEPLVDLVTDVSETGTYTAQHSYGARGWVLHQNTDLWRATAPMDGVYWGTFSTGGAWLCINLWDHYQYHPNEAYLRRIYPLLRGSALFFVDTLVEHRTEKVLVTCPANSPENTPHGPNREKMFSEIIGSKIEPNICAGPTIDMQILRDLFGAVIEASRILDRDAELRERLIGMRSRLAPMKIGRFGQLQEWLEDWDDPSDQHRHISHLYGLFPSCQITPRDTPALAAAAKVSLEHRGDFANGWSAAWKMGCRARLLDGNYAHLLFRNLIAKGTFANLFANCADAPQVDGTFGATAAIAEMLLQSYATTGEGARIIDLLPALPDAWPNGKVHGLCARGDFRVDMQWREGRLVEATITSRRGGACRVRYAGQTWDRATDPGYHWTIRPNDQQ